MGTSAAHHCAGFERPRDPDLTSCRISPSLAIFCLAAVAGMESTYGRVRFFRENGHVVGRFGGIKAQHCPAKFSAERGGGGAFHVVHVAVGGGESAGELCLRLFAASVGENYRAFRLLRASYFEVGRERAERAIFHAANSFAAARTLGAGVEGAFGELGGAVVKLGGVGGSGEGQGESGDG